MREIKFRGKRIDNNGWVYGDLYHGLNDCVYINTIVELSKNARCNEQIMVIPETVGQFRGLIDKNRIEIYEGDIVKEGSYNSKVEWTFEASCSCCNTASGYYWSDDEAKRIEVVGNIHENPELLC